MPYLYANTVIFIQKVANLHTAVDSTWPNINVNVNLQVWMNISTIRRTHKAARLAPTPSGAAFLSALVFIFPWLLVQKIPPELQDSGRKSFFPTIEPTADSSRMPPKVGGIASKRIVCIQESPFISTSNDDKIVKQLILTIVCNQGPMQVSIAPICQNADGSSQYPINGCRDYCPNQITNNDYH